MIFPLTLKPIEPIKIEGFRMLGTESRGFGSVFGGRVSVILLWLLLQKNTTSINLIFYSQTLLLTFVYYHKFLALPQFQLYFAPIDQFLPEASQPWHATQHSAASKPQLPLHPPCPSKFPLKAPLPLPCP